MNADYLSLESSMTLPVRSPLRRPPPPLPSRILMEVGKVIPPSTPSPWRSPHSPAADTDKPLPERPWLSRRSSSVYSDDSGYTKIIDLYSKWKVNDEPAAPIALQSTVYEETLTCLLARRFTESSSPILPLTTPQFPKHAVSIPLLRLTSEDLPVTSAVDVKPAPSFMEFSRSLQAKRSDVVSSLSSLASPHYAAVSHDTFWQPSPRSSPEFRAVPFVYEREHLPGEVSRRISDIIDSDLVPPPLDLGRSSRSSDHQIPGMLKAGHVSKVVLSEQCSSSRLSSTSSSDSSFVVYAGVRKSIRAIIGSTMGKNKDSVQEMKEKARFVASIEDQAPGSGSPLQPERKFSWVSSRKSSLQEGVTGILRTLSLTKTPSPNKQTPLSPQVRRKQLAIPLTPYQKCGTAVWHNSQRKKRRQAYATRAAQKIATPSGVIRMVPAQNSRRNPRQRSSEVITAFQSGRNQILDILGDTRQKIASTDWEKRKEVLQNNITLQGPGEKQEARHRLFHSRSERRREKLKKSIALVGPVDPYAVEPIVRTDSEDRKDTLKNYTKLVGSVQGESIRQAENWL